MPDILASGQWKEFSVGNRGALEIGLVAPVPATLEVVGTSSAPKYLGASRDAVAFPGRAVSAERPVIVRANVSSQEAFPGDCVVDVSFDAAGGEHAYLIRGIPVAGQASAPLLQLTLEGDAIRVRPGEGGVATLGLGGWCAKRRQESGASLMPTVTEVILDASASMVQHRPRVESFLDFVADLYATLGIAAPHVRSLSVGGSVDASSRGMGGVGSVQVDPDARGRRIVVTDIPLEAGRCECLVLGSPEIVRALAPHSGAPYFVPNGDAWNELLREDAAFTSQTLATMDPLLDWLAQPASSNASIGTSS